MKDNKHIKRFNESEENLNISDVSESEIIKQIEKMAEEYAKQFDYAEDSSPQIDFIEGAKTVLNLIKK
jgi:hypothetical protein